MTVGKEFAVLFAVLFLPGMVSQFGSVDPESFNSLWYHGMILVTSVPQVALVLWLAELRSPGSMQRFGWHQRGLRQAAIAAGGAIGCLALAAFAGVVAQWFTNAPGGQLIESPVAWSFTNRSLIPIAVLSTAAIGYREEVFYRAYLFDRGRELGLGDPVVILLSSLLFSLGHLYQGAPGFIVAFLVGGGLGFLYVRTKSLHGIALAHGLYNLIVLLASNSPQAG